MSNIKNFKNGCLSPLQWATGPLHGQPGPVAQPEGDRDLFAKKYLYLGPGVYGTLNSEF